MLRFLGLDSLVGKFALLCLAVTIGTGLWFYISSLRGDNADLRDRVAVLQVEVQSAEARIADLRKKVVDQNARITTLQKSNRIVTEKTRDLRDELSSLCIPDAYEPLLPADNDESTIDNAPLPAHRPAPSLVDELNRLDGSAGRLLEDNSDGRP